MKTNPARAVRLASVLIVSAAAMVVMAQTPASQPAASTSAPTSQAAFPPLLYAAEGARKILEYDAAGKVVWEYPAEMSRDAWRLPNGNTLFCFNNRYDSKKSDCPSGVTEVTPDKKVVFDFATTGQVWSCQRLADGTTLVGAASQGKLLIVDPNGKVAREIKLVNQAGHSCLRNARQVAGGNFLVAEESSSTVREYSPQGKVLREIKVNFRPYSAIRLANGNTVICGQMHLIEVDPKDNIVFSMEGKDVPELGIRWFAGLQILPNGNFFICNAGGKVPFAEISREKKIVWQSPPASSGIPVGHGIQRLDVKGEPLK